MINVPGRRAPWLIYAVIFAVSGFSGLIHESIWTHYLRLFLGHAAYAQTLVLVIFMGGMALGAWAASRYCRKSANLLLAYAAVEGLAGVMAVSFHPVYAASTQFAYDTVIPALGSPALVTAFKWTLAAALILPQTVMLGATFPLMTAGVIRVWPTAPGRTIATFYFANSLGAAAGPIAGGFVLIGLAGLPGTITAAGVINIAAALGVWALARGGGGAQAAEVSPPVHDGGRLFPALALVAAFTGAASFMYEIGWIRMLGLALGASTHSFELMLSAFVLGLALGGFWIRKRIDRLENELKTLGAIQILMGVFALATLLFYGSTFHAVGYAMSALPGTEAGYAAFNVFSHLLAFVFMLPATICAGMTLPLITHYMVTRGRGERAIGQVYAANTAGSIIGVILAVQLVMPALGLKYVIILGAVVDMAIGLALVWRAGTNTNRAMWKLTATASACAVFFFIMFFELDTLKMASSVFRHGSVDKQGKTALFHKDGKTASVDVIKASRPGADTITLFTNGKADAQIGLNFTARDEATMTLTAAVPMAVHPEARTAAVVGLGSGMTTHVLLLSGTMEMVDTIEIEPAMAEGAKIFGDRVSNTFRDPRSHIRFDDAKTYFTASGKSYDLIISEPSNPWVSGVAGLFTTEFYALVKKHLRDGGLLAQWVHLYETDLNLAASIIKAVSQNFENYSLYLIDSKDLLVVAGDRDVMPRPDGAVFSGRELAGALRRVGVESARDLETRRIGDRASLDPFFMSFPAPVNSDYYPYVDQMAVRARFLDLDASQIAELKMFPAPLLEAFGGQPTPAGREGPPGPAMYNKLAGAARLAAEVYAALTDDSGASIGEQRAGPIVDGVMRADSVSPSRYRASLRRLAWATLPYLSPERMERVWEKVFGAAGFDRLPGDTQDWARLYRAAGRRDYETMARLATELLPDGAIKATEDNDYLVAVGIMGNLAMELKDRAAALWGRYEGRDDPPPWLRLAAARLPEE